MLNKISKSFFIFLLISILIIASLPFSVSAADSKDYNYIVYTDDLGSIFGDGHVAFLQNEDDNGTVYTLPIINGSSGFLQNPFFSSGLKDSSKTAQIVVAQPTWVLDMGIFNGSKQYIFDFYIGVIKNGSNAFQSLKRFRFHFGNYNNKYYEPIEYIFASGSSTLGYAHFRFTVDGQVLINNKDYCTFEFLDFNANYSINFGLPKNTENFGNFTIREYTQADQIADIGSDISQPDFGSTNGALDDTTNQMESLEGEYTIDTEATNEILTSGTQFISGTGMSDGTTLVKRWIEDFADDNKIYISFVTAALCLGLCFWIIGRKGWE